MTRSECLDTAKKTICNDRNDQYGEPEDNFKVIAEFWSSYLGKKISSTDVANLMVLFKIARAKNASKEDTFIDICGYAACGCEIATKSTFVNADAVNKYFPLKEANDV